MYFLVCGIGAIISVNMIVLLLHQYEMNNGNMTPISKMNSYTFRLYKCFILYCATGNKHTLYIKNNIEQITVKPS